QLVVERGLPLRDQLQVHGGDEGLGDAAQPEGAVRRHRGPAVDIVEAGGAVPHPLARNPGRRREAPAALADRRLVERLLQLPAEAAPGFLCIAYPTWNRPLGVHHTPEQLEYDLQRMRSLGVRSLRVEFVWGEVEPKPGVLDFTQPDRLVRAAKRLGITLYPI